MIKIGNGSHVSCKAKIIGFSDKDFFDVVIGDNSYIGDDVQIICDKLIIGDYCKIHHHTNIHGNSVVIGHNAWVGQYSLLDGLGGIHIGDNFAVGPHSLLWSHAKYGDTLEGCRWDSKSFLSIGKDVWLSGGHTIINPVIIADKVMTLAGSVITKNLDYNRVYAGIPAVDITEKFGKAFEDVSTDYKFNKLSKLFEEFGISNDIKIVKTSDEFIDNGISYFEVTNRTYTKQNSHNEILFMKFLLPSRAKFTPITL